MSPRRACRDSVALLAVPNLTAIARHDRRSILRRAFADRARRRRHRHERQDDDCVRARRCVAAARQGMPPTPARWATAASTRCKPGTHTTPDCITVHRQLAELRDAGVRHLGMEVSSHALDQHRVDGVRFDTAVFTNLTRDHLDYHGTFEAYGAAKAQAVRVAGAAACGHQRRRRFGRELAERTARRLRPDVVCAASLPSLDVASHVASPVRARASALAARPGDRHRRQLGRRDAAFALRRRLQRRQSARGARRVARLGRAARTMRSRRSSNARRRRAAWKRSPRPASRSPSSTTRTRPTRWRRRCSPRASTARGKLICVFGCGGDRDAGKRPLMGAIAERLADRVIVTDDNPRTEDGDAIVADIVKGFDAPAARADRARSRRGHRSARFALGQPGDVVLIAGKGHEDYQIVGARDAPLQRSRCGAAPRWGGSHDGLAPQ